MPAPCPCGFAPGWGQEWLQLSHLGWSCPTEVVRGGLSQTNGHRWVWGPTEPFLHIWPHVALSAAPRGGHGITLVQQMGSGLCALKGGGAAAGDISLFLEVILQAGGGCGVTSACAMAASSSSLLPHLPPGLVAERTQERRRLHSSGSALSQMISPAPLWRVDCDE